MPGPREPEHGVRVRMDLRSADATGAVYDVQAMAAAATAGYTLRLASGAPPELARAAGGDGDEALETYLRALGRSLAKSGAWPRRVTRWRTGENG